MPQEETMGYKISTIKNIPAGLDCYYFLVGDYRNSTMVNDLFREGFDILAERVGQNNAIIANTNSTNNYLEWSLVKALHDVAASGTEISKYIREFSVHIPGLLITRKHPNQLTEKDTIIHIPFQILENAYSNSTELLIDLVAFAKYENQDLIAKVKKHAKRVEGLSFSISLGFFAINIDL